LLLLVFLDIIDCNPLVVKLFPKEYKNKKYCSHDETYEVIDKLLDVFQYFVSIALLKPIIPNNIYNGLLGFLIYRLLGILVFYISKIKQTYILFFDFIKEYLVLFLLFGKNIPDVYLISAIILKIIYEYTMHHKHFALELYKLVFERQWS
jgi:hypothetical protein